MKVSKNGWNDGYHNRMDAYYNQLRHARHDCRLAQKDGQMVEGSSMEKALILLPLTAVLLLALIGNAYAVQHVWSENFNAFNPVQNPTLYITEDNFTRWYEVLNSTLPANTTYTSTIVDDVLKVTAQTLIIHTPPMPLVYYRETHITSSLVIETKFAVNAINSFSINFVHTAGGDWFTNSVFKICIASGDGAGYIKYINTTSQNQEFKFVDSALPDVWYTVRASWVATPNAIRFLVFAGSNSTAIGNYTVTNNLYDFADIKGVTAIINPDYEATGFGRIYIDYIRIGQAGGTMMTPALTAGIVSIAMLGCVLGILKKMGKW